MKCLVKYLNKQHKEHKIEGKTIRIVSVRIVACRSRGVIGKKRKE